MSRSTPEWHGKHHDAAIPGSVKERVARKADDCCQSCRREIRGKLRAEFDHIIPLILGGEHRESNLQLLCNECHGAKTKLDVKIKARVERIHRRQKLGIKKPSRGFYDSSKYRARIGGGLVDRRTGEAVRRGYERK